MGNVAEIDDLYDDAVKTETSNRSCATRLSEVLMKKIAHGVLLQRLHDLLYPLVEKVNDHKVKFETGLANTVNKLLIRAAKQDAGEAPRAPSKPKVIKKITKVKIEQKDSTPSRITRAHVKLLTWNALSRKATNDMLQNGVPSAIVAQALGAVVDLVEDPGAADPTIWGGVM